jgi:predicted secreted Zn-dependent protease
MSQVKRYVVKGRNWLEITKAIAQNSPMAPYHAKLVWNVSWKNCISSLRYHLTIPSLSPSVRDPGLRKRFDKMLSKLLHHEFGHLKHGRRLQDLVAKDVERLGDCSGLLAIINRRSKQVRAEELRYDKNTKHGLY